MLCVQCQKREAAVFLNKITNNQVAQLALCRECAESHGLLSDFPDPFVDLLAEVGALFKTKTIPGRSETLRCPACGSPFSRFMKTGRLGCPDCYTAFRRPLADILKRIHGSVRHVGRRPKAAGGTPETPPETTDLKRLRQKLKDAVEREKFEEAARLRDHIRRVEGP